MDNNTTISNLIEMSVNLFEYAKLLRADNRDTLDALLETRRDVAKLEQQLNDLRKELADLKKTENE